MRLRWHYVLLVALLGVAASVLPAIASSETSPAIDAVNKAGGGLYGEETHAWSPPTAMVSAGGAVTLSNNTPIEHGVHWINPPEAPVCSGIPVGTTSATKGANWSGTCTFAKPGTYTFYCTVHGPEMTGTITVSSDGTTTTTPPTTTTTTITPPTPEPLSGSPLAGSPSLRSTQRGGTVKGSLDISKAGAGDRLEVDLFAKGASLATAKHSTRVRVGRFVRGSVSAGNLSFVVKLNAKARSALKNHHRLALSVKITLTPFYGEPTTVTRSVVEHG